MKDNIINADMICVCNVNYGLLNKESRLVIIMSKIQIIHLSKWAFVKCEEEITKLFVV